MNSLKLFYYQSVFLVTLYRGYLCQAKDDKTVAICELRLPDEAFTFVFGNQPLVRAAENDNEYYFPNENVLRLLGRKFTHHDVEVRYVFGSSLDFSLFVDARVNYIVLCQFPAIEDLQIFFGQQRKLVKLKTTDGAKLRKVSLFEKGYYAPVPVGNNGVFYQKGIAESREIGATKSFNLVRVYTKRNAITGSETQTQEADLVFLPRTYNITDPIGDDKFGLCIDRFPNSIFILHFTHAAQAMNFYGMVLQDVSSEISCSAKTGWLTKRSVYIDDPELFALPQHPFLSTNRQ